MFNLDNIIELFIVHFIYNLYRFEEFGVYYKSMMWYNNMNLKNFIQLKVNTIKIKIFLKNIAIYKS